MFYKAGLELRGQACPVGLDGYGIGTVLAVSFDAARKTQGQALIHFEPLASPGAYRIGRASSQSPCHRRRALEVTRVRRLSRMCLP